MERLQKQIRDNYLKAFNAVVEQSIVDEQFDFIVRLYDEIRQRIAAQIPRRVDLHAEIVEHMDVTIFRQLLENHHFGGADMVQLIEYVFGWLVRLQAPVRDRSTAAKKAEVLASVQTETFGKIVVKFLRATHGILDEIEADRARLHK